MKTRLACLLVASAILVLPDLAYACSNGGAQFADDFKKPDPGWIHSDHGKIGSSAITLMPAVAEYTSAYNASYIFSDADVCVQTKLDDFTKPDELSGGLLFWVTDFSSYFLFKIYLDSTRAVQRRAGSRWINISSGKSDAIKKRVGDLNKVEVRLSGNTGNGYVNGTKVATFNGHPPEGGDFFGVMAESENERANIWEFRDLKILNFP
jgi:hypothetical protein